MYCTMSHNVVRGHYMYVDATIPILVKFYPILGGHGQLHTWLCAFVSVCVDYPNLGLRLFYQIYKKEWL